MSSYQEIKALIEDPPPPQKKRYLVTSYGPENVHMAISDTGKFVHGK